MSFTGYLRYPTGQTLYVKPLPLNNSPWSTGVVTGVENGTLGSYAFAALTEGTEYEVFKRGGASPASSDLAVGAINFASSLDAAQIRSAIGMASADLDTQLDALTAQIGSPAQVANAAGDFTLWTGVDFDETFTVAVPVSWDKILFTIKDMLDLPSADSRALLQIQVSNPGVGADGLIRLNRAAATDDTLASITVAGDRASIDVSILAEATEAIVSGGRAYWDIAIYDGATKPYVSAPGRVTISSVVTRTLP